MNDVRQPVVHGGSYVMVHLLPEGGFVCNGGQQLIIIGRPRVG